MPPAQGVLVVKRLARRPSRATSRKFSFFHCPLLYHLLKCLIWDEYCDSFGGVVIVASAEDDAGVSFSQQQTATHHHHKERQTCWTVLFALFLDSSSSQIAASCRIEILPITRPSGRHCYYHIPFES